MEVFNLRSGTQTLPMVEMMEAIRHPPLGDDTFDEDPTVDRFETITAEALGKEAGLLIISGQMGNLVALMAHAAPGDEVLLEMDSHIFYYEAWSMAGVAGLMPMRVASHGGKLDPAEIRAAIRSRDLRYPTPRLLCLENTHNSSGSMISPPNLGRDLCKVAREYGLAIHLDGARVFNAAIKCGIPA